MNTILIIIILLSIITIVVIVIVVFVFYFFMKKERTKKIKELETNFLDNRLTKMESTISRVTKIAKHNKNFKTVEEDLYKIYSETKTEMNGAKRYIHSIQSKLVKMRMKEYKVKLEMINNHILRINMKKDEFYSISNAVMKNGDFIIKEMTFYQANIRNVVSVYRQKRILFRHIGTKIDAINNSIKKIYSEFEVSIAKGDLKQASLDLKAYVDASMVFANVIDQMPTIQTYIYTIIPAQIEEIVNTFKEKKKEMASSLDHINFDGNIKNIAAIFKSLKEDYLSLNLEGCRNKIKKTIIAINYLKGLIDYETKCQTFYKKNADNTTNQAIGILKEFIQLQKGVKKLIAKGLILDYDFTQLIKVIKSQAKALDIQITNVDKKKMTNVAYSSRVSRIKSLMNKSVELRNNVNQGVEYVWSYSTKVVILKNKLRKIEAVMTALIFDVKTKKIILTPPEKTVVERILKQLDVLQQNIPINPTEADEKAITNLMSETTRLYDAIGSKIEMTSIIKNILNELSRERAIDTKLNYNLVAVEKSYTDGKYTLALNNVISIIEKRGKQ